VDCPLTTVIDAFAEGLHAIDRCGVAHKAFQLGVGPYGEADAVRRALQHMRDINPQLFGNARTKRLPDILIPGQWHSKLRLSDHSVITDFQQSIGPKTFFIPTPATRVRLAIV